MRRFTSLLLYFLMCGSHPDWDILGGPLTCRRETAIGTIKTNSSWKTVHGRKRGPVRGAGLAAVAHHPVPGPGSDMITHATESLGQCCHDMSNIITFLGFPQKWWGGHAASALFPVDSPQTTAFMPQAADVSFGFPQEDGQPQGQGLFLQGEPRDDWLHAACSTKAVISLTNAEPGNNFVPDLGGAPKTDAPLAPPQLLLCVKQSINVYVCVCLLALDAGNIRVLEQFSKEYLQLLRQ